MTLNLPISAATVQSVDKFGIQFANITGSITYKIISAKLIGDGSTGGGSETEEETGITDGDVTGNVYALPGGSDNWMEYNYSVSNGTDSPISRIKIKVPFFEELPEWIDEMRDPRCKSYCIYTQADYIYMGIMKNICGQTSMSSMEEAFNEENCIDIL